jgi:selenocysteine lyase/cysteine desulfurase
VLQAKIACRNGHMYARRLMDHVYPDDSQSAMRENPLREADGGVVRLSLVHYNTMDEVERCIAALDRILE